MCARSVFLVGLVALFVHWNAAFAQMTAADATLDEQMPDWARPGGSRLAYHTLEDQFDRAFSAVDARKSQPSAAGIVTLHQLEHEVPGKAIREFQKAAKAEGKGDRAAAIEHLKKAVEIDPEFCAALNDLGANYLMTNRVGLAIEEFNKAIAIDPHAAMPYSNLTVAFLMQNNYQDAERAARQEVDLDRAGTRGRLMLGLSLVLQKKFTREAEQSLRKAAWDFPQASLLLARVLAANDRIESARHQLQQYLASGDRGAVDLAKAWMAQLDRSSAVGGAAADQH